MTSSTSSTSDNTVAPDPDAFSFRPLPVALRNAHTQPFVAWTQEELDELVKRKSDKDARATYKSIASYLKKDTWKVCQKLVAESMTQRKNCLACVELPC